MVANASTYTPNSQPSKMRLGERVFRKWIRPPDRRPPWQWAEENVEVDRTSIFSGKWKSATSPWVREVMEAWADHKVTDIGIMCSAQSAKTQTLLCALPWSICEDPGPTLWVMASRDDVVEFAANRLMPTLERCKALRKLMPKDRSGKKQHAIHFDSMPFEIVGAGSPSKLQSKPIRYLILDEVRNYPPGALEMALKRTRTYWNCKRVIISTPDHCDDHVHRAYKKGDQRKWFFPCPNPNCGQFQTLDWKQMKWGDPNDPTHAAFKRGPVWDYDALAPTIRYQCCACGHDIADTHFNRKHIINTGKWVRTNPTAPRHYVSFTWSALLPTWVTWRSLVEEFIDAQAALRTGDHQPLKAFINESLGEPWEDRLKEFSDFGFLEQTKRAYSLGDDWIYEKVRFLSIDVQKDHYRYVSRAFGIEGGRLVSRLIEYGRCNTELEIEDLRARLNVAHKNVMIDSGHEAPRIYRMCARYGWKAFKGTDTAYFPAVDPNTQKRVRRLWSVTHADPAMGTVMQGRVKPVKLFLTAKPGVQDMFAEWMMGMGIEWTLPEDVGEDYLKEVTASKRVERTDPKGHVSYHWVQVRKDNHYEDCETQIVVAALASGILKLAARTTTAPEAMVPAGVDEDGEEDDGS